MLAASLLQIWYFIFDALNNIKVEAHQSLNVAR
jgi:hypothetical protein